MFSLQTIFGSGQQFYGLLDEAAAAAHDSAKALHVMVKDADRQPALDEFKLARTRERAASEKIGKALVDSFITPIEREDIEALGSALYKIPKQIEKFAEVVNRAGYASPVRSPRGRDIMAACGQLKSGSLKQRASQRLATPA